MKRITPSASVATRSRRRRLPSLRELQGDLRRALLGDPVEDLVRLIATDGIAVEARLDIYRHHVFTSLTAALAATYPVVRRLVDPRFFAYAADAFIRRHPPKGPCLFEYGAELAEFLADFPACRHLAYLPDVARLEWAMNVAAHADDVVPLDPSALGAIDPADAGEVVFVFDPSMSVLRSAWPIDRIWRANQTEVGSEPTVDLTAGAVCLEVLRRDDVVAFGPLTETAHAFRRSLLAGEKLAAAVEAALALDPTADLAALLAALAEDRVIVGVSGAHTGR